MTTSFITKTLSIAAIAGAMTVFSAPAQAQSTEEVLGAIIGGSAGAVVGGELDNKGSKDEGKIIGAVVGGSLGYIVGSGLDNDNDVRNRYADRSGEFYRKDGQAYRRYRDADYGYVSFRVDSNDPYYYSDGRKKSHPVFGKNPGKAKGHYKKKRR